MGYLDTNSRTTKTPNSDKFQQIGRTTSLFGVFLGFVKRADDVQKNGRLQVWIPEFGSGPDEAQGWVTVNYCSPFAGATNVDTNSKSDIQQFEGTQTSYGMWAVPPDINNTVLVMFINGDPSKGIWIGSLYNQFMNNMVPGMASSTNNYQYPGKDIPVAEYNKNDKKVTLPDQASKPYEATKFKGIGNQGLINDKRRGVTKSSARRESPSSVFGILTPGPVIAKDAEPGKIRRKGGSSFIMDDGTDSEYIQFATKSGAQININETTGFVYLINRDGTAWVQMDSAGDIDIFGARNISMRAQRDINLRADRNINIEAGQNIFMKAAKDTVEGTTTFTYDVNNIPKPTTIPVWNVVGEGNGQGGNIVMQAMNNWHSTTKNTAYLTVNTNNMNINIGNALNVVTRNGGQQFNSKQGVRITTDASFDLAATGNIRIGSKGSISAVGATQIVLCTDGSMSLKAVGDMAIATAGNASISASQLGIIANTKVGGILGVTGLAQIQGGLQAAGPTALGGVVVVSPPTEVNPQVAEGALSAGSAATAEIKPMNDKLNILATWQDPASKFKRNSKSLQTIVSRFPTYEPCPEHETFTTASVVGFKPIITTDDKTYEGSGAAGNSATTSPAPAVNPGANNTMIQGDPVGDSAVSKDVNTKALRYQLIIHEGLVTKSYTDSVGLLTGGIGHLLRANEVSQYPLGTPISETQIESWYIQDSVSAIKIAQELLGDPWGDLSDIRKRACTDLAYNLGKGRLGQFVNFLAAMKALNYNKAGQELRSSKWFGQVGKRGPNIITMIVHNIDPTGSDKKALG